MPHHSVLVSVFRPSLCVYGYDQGESTLDESAEAEDSDPEDSDPPETTTLPAINSATLNAGDYHVIIERGGRRRLGEAMREAHLDPDHIIIIYDSAVSGSLRAGYTDALENSFADACVHEIRVACGEQSKSLAVYHDVIEQILALGVSRDSVIVGLGGGVIGDLAGFVAATVLRGLALVQCPTTLLAAVDSSIGGKTGINSRHGKNLIGAFYPARLVVTDIDCFATLPASVIRHGYAEVVKIAAIQDTPLLSALEQLNTDTAIDITAHHWVSMIKRAVMLKVAVVNSDHREHNIRAYLNFGHTFAHALEKLSGFAMAHGDAVAIGMMLANYTGQALGFTEPSVPHGVYRALTAVGLPNQWDHVAEKLSDTVYDGHTMLAAMRGDKKFRKGAMHFVFLPRLGENPVIQSIKDEDFLTVWPQAKNMIQHPPGIITDLHK